MRAGHTEGPRAHPASSGAITQPPPPAESPNTGHVCALPDDRKRSSGRGVCAWGRGWRQRDPSRPHHRPPVPARNGASHGAPFIHPGSRQTPRPPPARAGRGVSVMETLLLDTDKRREGRRVLGRGLPRTGRARRGLVTPTQTAQTEAGPAYLSGTWWWPRSTGFEVATGAGVGRGVRAAVVQTRKGFCPSPLLVPRAHDFLELPWDPCWLRASKQRQS